MECAHTTSLLRLPEDALLLDGSPFLRVYESGVDKTARTLDGKIFEFFNVYHTACAYSFCHLDIIMLYETKTSGWQGEPYIR